MPGYVWATARVKVVPLVVVPGAVRSVWPSLKTKTAFAPAARALMTFSRNPAAWAWTMQLPRWTSAMLSLTAAGKSLMAQPERLPSCGPDGRDRDPVDRDHLRGDVAGVAPGHLREVARAVEAVHVGLGAPSARSARAPTGCARTTCSGVAVRVGQQRRVVADLAQLADDVVEALPVARGRGQAMVLVRQADGLQALLVAQDFRPPDRVSQRGGVRVRRNGRALGQRPARPGRAPQRSSARSLFLIRCEMDASSTGRAVLTMARHVAAARTRVR